MSTFFLEFHLLIGNSLAPVESPALSQFISREFSYLPRVGDAIEDKGIYYLILGVSSNLSRSDSLTPYFDIHVKEIGNRSEYLSSLL